MNAFPRPLILLSVLAVIIAFSGCIGLDPTALATSNSMIKQFMDEHPNAEIKVTHFTAAQSKNMIDQIRKDCDNPYIDEKEFYRVNVTDPDTNFYATVWIDWGTKTVECVFKMGTEGKVVEKPKPKPECESHNYSKCDSGHLYWFDSCGSRQEKKQYCEKGCSGETCLGECKSQAEARCYGDSVYWFDSCGNKQDKKEYCNYGCENGFCKTQRPEKTCEGMGGYCIRPPGYCGDGICSESESQQVCEEVCPSSPAIRETAQTLATPVTGNIIGPTQQSCTDSDGGRNYLVKGIVTGSGVDGSSLQLNDVCEGNYVHEYFCQTPNPNGNYLEKENYGWVNYLCPYQCKDGICISEKPVCGNGVCESGEETTCSQDCGAAACKDSDGGLNVYEKGTAGIGDTYLTDTCQLRVNWTGDYQYNLASSCSGSNDCFVDEAVCDKYSSYNNAQGLGHKLVNCPNGCSSGACKKECKMDSDCYPPGFTPGKCGPFYTCSNGKCYEGSAACQPEGCQKTCRSSCPQDCETIPYSGGGNSEGEGQAICEKKCATSGIKFADFRTGKEAYYVREAVHFFAKLADANGNPAIPEQGIGIYLFAVSPTGGPMGARIPINYSYTSGYYEYATTPIPSNIDFGTWTFFATAENSESFVTSENVYVAIKSADSAAQATVPIANPAPYEGCINKCLLRFRLADVAMIAPSAAGGGAVPAIKELVQMPASTGMVVAVETTATSTRVSYQCREGYETGNYFCREGGICCIPKTVPPIEPAEFCGSSTQGPCYSDAECKRSGCSGQICQSAKEEPVGTRCDYKECYNAEKFGMKCGCLDGRCQWAKLSYSCGNGICEPREADECPACTNYDPPCMAACKAGACPQDCRDTICKDSTGIGIYRTGDSWKAPDGCNTCTCRENGQVVCTTIACLGCTDSDGGKNYYQKGTAAANGQSFSDFCNDDFTLTEKFCEGNEIKWEYYKCPIGCKEGACIKETACTQDAKICPDGSKVIRVPPNCDFTPCPTTINCTETDGGKYDYYTKGTITYQQGSFADFCVSPTMLTENYCDLSYYPPYQGRADSYICPNGCLNGACIKEPNVTANCTNLCYGNIRAYTLGANESVKIEGYDFRIVTLLTQPPQNELSYWYDGNSGNLGIGDIDLQYYTILGNYFLVNPVFRNQTHAILNIGKCDTTCLDYACGNYCFENSRFYDGKYISWLPDGKRVMCDDYKNESCPNGCSNGACIQ